MKPKYPSLPSPAFRRPGPSPTGVGATIVLILVIMAGLGYGSQTLLYKVWDRVVGYQSPYTAALAVTPSQAPPLTGAVVLIVVDGLRVDASREMAKLNEIRAGAVNLIAQTEQPSLSLPGGAAIGTGAPPYVHGVTTNWFEGPILVDSIFAAVKRAGLPTAHIGWDGWLQLYGEDIDIQLADPAAKTGTYDDAAVRDLAAQHLAAGAPAGLTVVYFSSTDEAGHSYGGASPEYLATVQEVDGYIGELMRLIDLTTTTVLITADHGHIDTGGHGGPEPVVTQVPLVLAGLGIAPAAPGGAGASDGNWPLVRQVDIAPTIAALLGAEVPTHALGLHLSDWLSGDATWQAQRMITAAATRVNISAAITGIGAGTVPAALTEAQTKLAEGDNAGALAKASEYLSAEQVERGKVQTGVSTKRQATRFWPALAMALLPALFLLLLAKPPRLWGALLAAGLFFAGFWAVYRYGHGLTYSFSAFNSEDQIRGFITLRLVEGAALMLVAGLIGALIARDIDFGLQTSAGLGALWTGVFVLYGLSLHVIWFYYQQGLVYPDYLPNLVGGFKTLVYLITMTGAGFAAIGATLLSIAASGIIPSRRPARLKWTYR